MAVWKCKICGGACGIVCRGFGFASDVAQLPPAKTSRVVEVKQAEAAPPAKTGRGGRPRLGEEGKTLRARKALARRRHERANVVSPQEGRAMSINPPNRNQPRIVRSHGRTDGNLALSKDPEAPAIKRSVRDAKGDWPLACEHPQWPELSERAVPRGEDIRTRCACVARNGRDRGGEVSKLVYGA